MTPSSLWQRLLQALRWLALDDERSSDAMRPPDAPRRYELDAALQANLRELAELEQRPVEELTHDLLQQALYERRSNAAALLHWNALTPRQQDIAALVCLGYTNQQIAVRLSISPETVKTHVSHVLDKFALHTRVELRHMLSEWDFSAWEPGAGPSHPPG